MSSSYSHIAPTDRPLLTPDETYKQTERRQEPPPEELLNFLQKLTGRLRLENTEHNKTLHAKGLTNEMMYRGQQYGRVDLDGNYRNYRREKGDPRYTHNLYGGYSDSITSQHVLARTDLEVMPLPTDDADDHAAGKARFAEHYINYCERRQLTESFRIRQSKLRQFGGGVFRYVFWDPKGGLGRLQRPILENQAMQLAQDAFTCSACGESGEAEMLTDGQSCPYCGSDQVAITQVPNEEMPQTTGYDEEPVGEGRTILIPNYQMDYDRHSGSVFYEATWVRWQQRFRPEVIQEICPWWKNPGGTTMAPHETESGLRTEAELRQAPGNTRANFRNQGSRGNSGAEANAPQMVTAECWWLRPCLYANAPALGKEARLGDPENPSVVIPQGGRLKDGFGKGMYLLTIDRRPVDFWDEDFRRRLTYIPYKLIPSKIEGDGIENMNEPQRAINLVRSLIVTDIKSNAAPPTLYRPDFIKGGQYSGKPQENVPVQNWPPNQSLEGVVYTPQGRQMPAHVYNYDDKLSQEMQWDSKATPTSTGAAMLSQGVGERTATGAKLMSQGAAAQRAPENALLTEADEIWGMQQLFLFVEHATEKRYIPFGGKTTGMEGQWLKGSDLGNIEAELLVVARDGSNLPQSDDDKQRAYSIAMQMLGGPAGVLQLAQAAPEMLAAVEKVFRIKFEVSEYDLDARQSRFRMDAMKRAMPQAMQVAQAMGMPEMAPAMLLEAAPIRIKTDNHAMCIKWLTEWSKEDEGLNADPLLIAAVDMRIDEHNQAMVTVEQQKAQMQLAAQAPMIAAQQAMQGEQEQKGQQREDQVKQGDRQHEQEQGDKSHQQNLEMEALKGTAAPAAAPKKKAA
jgi:hypothetical protein